MKPFKSIFSSIFLLLFINISSLEFNENSLHYCNYLKHEIRFLSNSNDSFELINGTSVFTFNKESLDNEKAEFIFNTSQHIINEGNASIKQINQNGDSFRLNIVFTDYLFEPELQQMRQYDILNIKLKCPQARSYVKFYYIDNETEIPDNFPSTSEGDGFDLSNAKPGKHIVKAVNPYTNEEVIINTFTQISNKTSIYKKDIHIELPMPTSSTKNEIINITYPKQIGKMRNIHIKRNENYVYYDLQETHSQGRNFTIEDNGNMYKVIVNIKYDENNINYTFHKLIFDNFGYVAFEDDEYGFGYYFSIEKKLYINESNIETILTFSSESLAKEYQNIIQYKDLTNKDNRLKQAICIPKEHDLICNIQVKEKAIFGIGIGHCLISSQIVIVFSFTYTPLDINNLCIVKNLNTENSVLRVTMQFPNNYIQPSFNVTTYLTNSSEENMCISTPTNDSYNFECNLNELSPSNYSIEVKFEPNQEILKIDNYNFIIKNNYQIEQLISNQFYLISEDQLLTISFSSNIPEDELTQIKLVQQIGDLSFIESGIISMESNINSTTRSYLISNIENTSLITGVCEVYYKSPCNDDSFIPTGQNINLEYNPITNVEPLHIKMKENYSTTVTYQYKIGNKNPYLVFMLNEFKLNYPISDPQITDVNILGTFFKTQGEYSISTLFNYNEAKSKYKLFVFTGDITFKENRKYISQHETLTSISIPLENEILKEQIEKIIYSRNNENELEIKDFDIDRSKQLLIITVNKTYDDLGDYDYMVYDYIEKNKSTKYTITILSELNLMKEDIGINITLPAVIGNNYVYFNFTSKYDINNIVNITYTRLNRATDEEEDIVFCNETMICENNFEILSQDNQDLPPHVIRTTIIFNETEKYLYKYILKSISDDTLTRQFENNKYVLLDFLLSTNIFGFLNEISSITTTFEMFDNITAEQFGTSIQCEITNKCKDMDSCIEDCLNSCDNTCNHECYIEGNQMTCTFKFDTIYKESTVFYRFTEQDQHPKPLHILKIIPPKGQCHLSTFNENIEIQICSSLKVNDLRLFLSNETEPVYNDKGIEINFGENDCNMIDASYYYFTGSTLHMKVIRNNDDNNSFELNTLYSSLFLLDEIMLNYQGELYAQLSDMQNVKFTFTDKSNISNIENLTFIHKENNQQIVTENCKIDEKNSKELNCFYNLENLTEYKDIGEYDIVYFHTICKGRTFNSTLKIKIKAPPNILQSIMPTYSLLEDPGYFILTYRYLFYQELNNFPNELVLVKTDNEEIISTVYLNLDSNIRNNLSFNTEPLFTSPGMYYVIEHFPNEISSPINKDKQILFYSHPIGINPENITYYTDESAPSYIVTNFIDSPIIPEQIQSVTLNDKDVMYDCTSENISFLFMNGLIDFFKEGTYAIEIMDIQNSNPIIFTVYVKKRLRLQDANIIVSGPSLGYENQTNYVSISTKSDYSLERLTRVVFKTMNEYKNEIDYIVDKQTILENYNSESNIIELPLVLHHDNYYEYYAVYNDDLNDVNTDSTYTLHGFYLKSHFYFYPYPGNSIDYYIVFNNTQIAQNKVNSIYESNVLKETCDLEEENSRVIKCSYVFDEDKPLPKTLMISIKLDEDLSKELPIYLIQAKLSDNCFTTELIEQQVNVEINIQNYYDSIRGILNEDIFNGSLLECVSDNDDCLYSIDFDIPIQHGKAIYNLYVDFQREGEFFRLEIPNGQLNIINYFTLEAVIDPYIYSDTIEQIFFRVKFSHEITDSDISHVELEQVDSQNDKIMLDKCSVDVGENNTNQVYTCIINTMPPNGIYFINPYNACKDLVEPSNTFFVHISNSYNALTQITPKSVRIDNIEETSFIFIYHSSSLLVPSSIELVNSTNISMISPYNVIFISPEILETEKLLNISAKLTPSTELGLFRINSTFDDNITTTIDCSQLTILIYENEVKLHKTNQIYELNSTITELTIQLEHPIILEQINKITYAPISGFIKEFETIWDLSSETEIKIYFDPEILLTETYNVIIYLAQDEAIKQIVTLHPVKNITFNFSREFVDMGNDDRFTLTIKAVNDNEHKVEKIVSNDSNAVINRNLEKEISYDDNGNIIESKMNVWYTMVYNKRNSFLPLVINFDYYYQGVSEPFKVNNTVKITDSKYSFFNYKNVNKIFYKDNNFELILEVTQTFDKINYTDLQAFFKYKKNENEEITDLIHDTINLTRFYLNSTNSLTGKEVELIIYEKNNRDAIVDQGEIFIFKNDTEPQISNEKCLNGGFYFGGYCKCPNGFYGKSCQYQESEVNDFIDTLIKNVVNVTVNLQNEIMINDILDLTAIASQKDIEIPSMEAHIETYKSTTPTTVKEASAFFAWGSLILKGMNENGRINEESFNEIIHKGKTISKEWIIPNGQGFVKFSFPLQNIYFHKVLGDKESFNKYILTRHDSDFSYFEISNLSDSHIGFYLLSANERYNDMTDNSKKNISINVEYISDKTRMLSNTNEDKEVVIYYSLDEYPKQDDNNKIGLNRELLTLYSVKGINIYNVKDSAFAKKCYSTNPEIFEYDLTQKYRKKFLYQNISFIMNNSDCVDNGFSNDFEYLQYKCSSFKSSNKLNAVLELQELKLENNSYKTINHLSLKCLNGSFKIKENIAFWLFLAIIIIWLGMLMSIGFIFKDKYKIITNYTPISHSIKNSDKIEPTEINELPEKPIEKPLPSTNAINDYSKTFKEIIITNIKMFYIFTSFIFNGTLPFYIILGLYTFSLSVLFFFNALFFSEKYMDKRIEEKKGYTFANSLTDNAGIIFGSIFLSWLVSMFIKLILSYLIFHDDNFNSKENFNKKVVQVFCLIISVFCVLISWIYCIGFSMIYVNSQYGWFYSCIWALLFSIIIFSPFFILIISVFEFKFSESNYKIFKIIKHLIFFSTI